MVLVKENYLFGPFIGETTYELNYFVGHAIYLRRRNPKNRIIVLTRKENFDLYGRYATTLIPLPLSDGLESYKFGCKNLQVGTYDEIVRQFKFKYKDSFKIHDHFYPQLATYQRNIKWLYPRDQINFDFRPRPKNNKIAQDIVKNINNVIISEFHLNFQKIGSYQIIPYRYFINKLTIDQDCTILGILIEVMRKSRFIHGDIDSILGRLAMLMKIPLISQRGHLDMHYLNPLNPYKSIVIGCSELEDGIAYLEEIKNEYSH